MLFASLISIHFLRSLPVIGQFIPALWVLNYARYTITNTKHVYLRATFFLVLILLTLMKSLHPYTLWLLHLQMASTSLARELFDTYLSRIHTRTITNHRPIPIQTHSTTSRYQCLGFLVPSVLHPLLNWQNPTDLQQPINPIDLPHRKITHFLRDNYFLLLAFAFPYVFLFSIPLLGFFCVGFAHGAAAYTLATIVK
jgi:Ca2+/Na+ antiporter